MSTILIGMVARYHPMKDHANFITAAAKLHHIHPEAHFILVGPEIDNTNIALIQLINDVGLNDHFHLLGERTDIAHISAGLDIASLSSAWGDAFPNVIGEAMACEVPCVATDIGDTAKIIDDTGIVVPPEDSDALYQAWETLIDMGVDGRARLGVAARQRIINFFSISEITHQYETLYNQLVSLPNNENVSKR
jgi:glycosyltransferase involved in cell wall biosynthesis